MEIRQLKTFQAVGQLLSFNRAARVLHYAQSTVSAQVKLLEEELGVRLFDRLGKSIVLTEAGARLMKYSEKLLALEAETRSRVSGMKEPVGTISIRAPQSIGTYVLPRIIKAFNRIYPRIGFDVNPCAYRPLRDEFRNGVTDLAFLLQDSISAADLTARVLGYTKILTVCASHHPLADRKRFFLKDFSRQTLIIPKHDCSYRMEFEQRLTDHHILPDAKITANSLEIVKQLVLNGTGIALIPEIAIQKELYQDKIKILPWPGPNGFETCILMIVHKNKWISPQLRAFMDLAGEHTAQSAGSDELPG